MDDIWEGYSICKGCNGMVCCGENGYCQWCVINGAEASSLASESVEQTPR